MRIAHRHLRVVRAVAAAAVGLLARVRPSTTGSTASRWLGFEDRVTVISPAGVGRVALGAEVVLDVAACRPPRSATIASTVRSPSNSSRIDSYGRPITWASTFSRPRWAIPITTSCAPASAASCNGLVEHRYEHVEPLDRELLLAQEGAAEVELEALDAAQALEQRPLFVGPSGCR